MQGTFGQFYQTVMIVLERDFGFKSAAKFVSERPELIDVILTDFSILKYDPTRSIEDGAKISAAKIHQSNKSFRSIDHAVVLDRPDAYQTMWSKHHVS